MLFSLLGFSFLLFCCFASSFLNDFPSERAPLLIVSYHCGMQIPLLQSSSHQPTCGFARLALSARQQGLESHFAPASWSPGTLSVVVRPQISIARSSLPGSG